MDLLKRTAEYIDEYELIKPGSIVLVAFSAGRDSRVLLDILAKIAKKKKFAVAAANFDHQLRKESAEEADFAASICAEYGIDYYRGTADVATLSKGKNIQEIARRERYAFLRQKAVQIGAASIVMAHHANDQAETLLLHLLRGSGLSGLSAMSPNENGVIRPLLFAAQQDIIDYAEKNNLEFRQDMTNFSVKYQRNKIRLELIPLLSQYNPRIVEALAATADICAEEDELLDDLAENSLAELWLVEDNALNGPGFDQLPPALKRRVLRKAFCLFAGERPELSYNQANAVISLKDEQSVALPGGKIAYRRGHIFFGWDMPDLPEYTDVYGLVVDGQWHKLGLWGWSYMARSCSSSCIAASDSFVISDDLAEKLFFRTRRVGDSVYSNGKTGKKKIKELYIDAGLPKYEKNAWPLLIYNQEIVWLPYLFRRQIVCSGQAVLIKVRKDDILM